MTEGAEDPPEVVCLKLRVEARVLKRLRQARREFDQALTAQPAEARPEPLVACGVQRELEVHKQSIYAAYGIASHVAGYYEVDHLVPVELGGNNARANLWPERAPGFGRKDSLETAHHDAVCAARWVSQPRSAAWRGTGSVTRRKPLATSPGSSRRL